MAGEEDASCFLGVERKRIAGWLPKRPLLYGSFSFYLSVSYFLSLSCCLFFEHHLIESQFFCLVSFSFLPCLSFYCAQTPAVSFRIPPLRLYQACGRWWPARPPATGISKVAPRRTLVLKKAGHIAAQDCLVCLVPALNNALMYIVCPTELMH